MNSLQSADVTPTVAQRDAIVKARTAAAALMTSWNTLRTTELAALNIKLKAAGLPAISVTQ